MERVKLLLIRAQLGEAGFRVPLAGRAEVPGLPGSILGTSGCEQLPAQFLPPRGALSLAIAGMVRGCLSLHRLCEAG